MARASIPDVIAMPIYEYQCQDCGHKLEVMQRVADAPQTTCPSCRQETLKKLISPVGFQLKGTGWYVTDFRDKGKPKADKDAGEKAGASAAKSDADQAAGGGKSDGGKSDGGKSESGTNETSKPAAAASTSD
jgi:putative FmdB family regulatory protein